MKCLFILLFFFPMLSFAGDYTHSMNAKKFIDEMMLEHDYGYKKLTHLLSKAKRQDRALELIQKPAEAKPWYEYRDIFLTEERIRLGVEFWNKHAGLIQKASKQYGVAPEIIVAIIGVETYYGRQTGGFPVFDTLVTLGFDYPPRGEFFSGQLKDLLLLVREEKLSLHDLQGSYAGAMGMGQFIPSSYRHYAVDFDQDGQRDLWHSPADAIGSVANYFKQHGWKMGQPVVVAIGELTNPDKSMLEAGMKPSYQRDDFIRAGINLKWPSDYNDKAALLDFTYKDRVEYWAGLHNFYVITRYNHSILYARAVYELSQAIKQQRGK